MDTNLAAAYDGNSPIANEQLMQEQIAARTRADQLEMRDAEQQAHGMIIRTTTICADYTIWSKADSGAK